MAQPNTITTAVPSTTGGNSMGVQVGTNPAEPLSFFGAAGSVQVAGSGITTVAGLVAALQAYGLLG